MKTVIIYKKNFLSDSEERKGFRSEALKKVKKILKEEKKILSSLSLIFCSDEYIKEYNKKYLNHDYETDIITFHDVNEEGLPEGELLISVDTVKNNSVRFRTDFRNELMRVIIHGILHLCGYEDKTLSDKKTIKNKEDFYLKI